MDYWMVVKDGDPEVRMCIAKDGRVTFAVYAEDVLKLADERSAHQFQRACETADLRQYARTKGPFKLVHVKE